ncbi:MAG TPA: ElyC/SanA/YdcF family protein, partial [Chthoniobacterales bacterium]
GNRRRAAADVRLTMRSNSGQPKATSRTKFGGLVRRKEVWRPTWRGWLLLSLATAGITWLVILNAYSFLAVNRPVQADMLVVEGWVHDYAIRTAAEEFTRGAYKAVFSTGGPVPGTGGYTNDFNTSASVGAERLVGAGIPRELVHTVASREAMRDRTYGSAAVLKRWFHEHGTDVRAVNVMTETTHARRTLLLFQKALGPEIKVGVIPILNPDTDPDNWWRYSDGVRDVIGESLAYVYAKLFFSPQ